MVGTGAESPDLEILLDTVGPSLRAVRQQRGLTLEELAKATGISVSSLSRTETGKRRPTLELLLGLSQFYQVALDDLIGAPAPQDPRVRLHPRTLANGQVVWPLTNTSDGVQAWKIELPAATRPPKLHTHQGYEWFYVLRGNVRLVLDERTYVLVPGDAVEFDTRTPHWFGGEPGKPAQILSLFSREGERVHLTHAGQ